MILINNVDYSMPEKPLIITSLLGVEQFRIYKTLKIFGTVEDPRSATWVFFTITEPDGKTSQVKGDSYQ